MSDAMELTADSFATEVEQGETPVLVDFWAPWCGPCKMMAPVLDEVAKSKADKVKIAKINCDDEAELAGRFGITGIPCMILFKGAEEVDRKVGAVAQEDLEAWLDEKLA
ncbi:MAG: thioredoxin [Planctomycetota bacterium]|jgi:thioredoxin 1